MTPTTRLSAAAAVGFFADLSAMGDAYRHQEWMRGDPPVLLVCSLSALLLVHAVRNFGERLTFVTAAVWGGLALAHTMRQIAEISSDPTRHNLWSFAPMLLFVLAVPPLIGAATGHFAGQAWAARSWPRFARFLRSAKGRVSAPPNRIGTRGMMAAGPWPRFARFLRSAKGRVSAPPNRIGTRGMMAAGPWPRFARFLRSAKGRVSAPPNRIGTRGMMAAGPWPRFARFLKGSVKGKV